MDSPTKKFPPVFVAGLYESGTLGPKTVRYAKTVAEQL